MITPPAPDPAAQIRFLQQIRRLLSDGSFVASYKFALLHAIADLVVIKGEEGGAELRLSTRELAEQVIVLYWRQSRPFPAPHSEPLVLQQNAGRQAKIISDVEKVQHQYGGSLAALQRRREEWSRLVGEVEATVQKMPLWKLQTVGDERLDFLYENLDRGNQITLRPGVAYCLRTFYDLVTDLVRGAWLRYVRRYNASVLGESSELGSFLFGSERSNLAVYQPILMEVQRGLCFYCERALRTSGEVDHFVAWSRYPVDLGHNFVLADAACNRHKSDHLAAEPHLERWLLRNDLHHSTLLEAFGRAGVVHDRASSERVAQWAYAQAERIGLHGWHHGATLVPISGEWKTLFRH
jgi:hypothetical protein